MAELVGARIKDRMRQLGLTQVALAQRVGLSQPTIGRIINGETRETTKLIELAQALETTPEYLVGDDEVAGHVPSAQAPAVAASEPIEDDVVEVKELDLAFGMGGGSYLDLPVRPKGRRFSRDWLRLFTQSPPSKVFIARGVGDSMAPTIQNDDLVIIDTAQSIAGMGDHIWAIAYGNAGLIKRLRPLPDGSVKIMSDNKLVDPEVAYDQELHVIGKVVAVVRRMAG